MTKRPAAVRLVLALGLATIALWTFPAVSQTKKYLPQPLKASSLMGMRVEDTDGHKIGTIRNLVLDTRSGTLRYAVIASGGVFGVDATLKLAPANAMSAATTKRATLAVNATTTQWNRAPVFKRSKLDALAEPGAAQEVSRHFEPAPSHAGQSLSVTGNESGEHEPKPDLKFASDLMGMHVVNAQQERIGDVLNLLVGFARSRPAFAIISSGRFFHHGPQFAVPLNALSATGSNRQLMLNVDTAALQNAPAFNQQVWNSSLTNASPQVYSYQKPED
ncbi:MAG TPA: PRC-barrel domain-containing protein [Candidatus Angelobacter sp.]|nr:PRC-barrel domain-containing protein [Candidatus Angelobacter sp.]